MISNMTYSHDLRIKALDYIENGGSQVEASRIFGVTVHINFSTRSEFTSLTYLLINTLASK